MALCAQKAVRGFCKDTGCGPGRWRGGAVLRAVCAYRRPGICGAVPPGLQRSGRNRGHLRPVRPLWTSPLAPAGVSAVLLHAGHLPQRGRLPL